MTTTIEKKWHQKTTWRIVMVAVGLLLVFSIFLLVRNKHNNVVEEHRVSQKRMTFTEVDSSFAGFVAYFVNPVEPDSIGKQNQELIWIDQNDSLELADMFAPTNLFPVRLKLIPMGSQVASLESEISGKGMALLLLPGAKDTSTILVEKEILRKIKYKVANKKLVEVKLTALSNRGYFYTKYEGASNQADWWRAHVNGYPIDKGLEDFGIQTDNIRLNDELTYYTTSQKTVYESITKPVLILVRDSITIGPVVVQKQVLEDLLRENGFSLDDLDFEK